MELIKWGIIGCGDVTEVKSGPAFNKAGNSSLVAVMRRDAVKAKDYASRHGVPKWYNDAYQLIEDPDINAIYVATPPFFHEEYTIAALRAGKPVYVEKPMAMEASACRRMVEAAHKYNTKLSVAHYRRALPLYLKVKGLLESNTIGQVLFVECHILQPLQSSIIVQTTDNWRVDPALSGGGLFHDVGPHHLDLMLHYFGKPAKVSGVSANQRGLYKADDIVSGEVLFSSRVILKGLWCFTVPQETAMDNCRIVGSEGTINFPFYGNECVVSRQGNNEPYYFENILHIQQPFIEKVVHYFLDKGPNPCSGEEAIGVMEVMDTFTKPDRSSL